MAITYPLNTPTNIGIANITLMAENAVAVSQSPFTFSQQIVAHPGQRWAASISLPPMKRQDAENWIAFLLSLKGQVGTFLLGDPNGVNDQGVAAARRNLLTYTEQFSNAAWVKTRSSIAIDSVVAPDGTTTADTLIEDTSASTHLLTRTLTFTAGVTYTYSIYVKAQSARNIRLDFPTTPFGGTSAGFFDATTGAVTSVNGVTATTTSVGNGWYRFTITKTATAGGSGTIFAYLITGATTVSYTGDGVSGVYIWGAQVEESSSASAYQGVVDTLGPLVNGASQTGNVLNIDGCSPNVTGWFAPGDYIQLGSGSATQLYKVLTNVDTNNSGQASVDIWPNLRSSPADNSAVIFTNAKGKFRLKDNVTQWGINEISSYGITFDCVEAL